MLLFAMLYEQILCIQHSNKEGIFIMFTNKIITVLVFVNKLSKKSQANGLIGS
jgi:hypothetical protein